MADFSLTPGLTGEYRVHVTRETTAHHTGHTGVYVYSTSQLVLAMEMACAAALAGRLPEGWNHVGISNHMTHLAATPVGFDVVARAELVDVDGRRLVFQVEAHDNTEKIGEGRHERALVDWARFTQRLEAKAAARPQG
jgi:predicted thioesterase